MSSEIVTSDSEYQPHSEECECSECCDSCDDGDEMAVTYSVINAMETICEEFGYVLDDEEDTLLDELVELFKRHAKVE